MKKILILFILNAFATCFASELVSTEDSKRLLNTNQKTWLEQVDLAVKSGAAKKIYWQYELGMSVVAGDILLDVIPSYISSSSLPSFLTVNISFPPDNQVARESDEFANSICKKIVFELKSQLSVLCAQSGNNGWRKFYVVTSTPGKYIFLDRLNASGNYSLDIEKFSEFVLKNSELMLSNYWLEIEKWVSSSDKTKAQNIEFAVTKIPEICGKLATIYSLKSGLTVEVNKDFSMDADVCAKVTVHRKFPQPEFDNPKIVQLVCGSKLPLYQEVCRRANLNKLAK